MKCVVILGCKQNTSKLNSELMERAEKAISLFDSNSLIIASGGNTNGIKAESTYIKEYLIERGIPSNKIIEENLSQNTFENAKFSITLIKEKGLICSELIVVTSCYHSIRAGFIFRNMSDIPVITECVNYERSDSDESKKFIIDALRIYNRII